MAENLRVTHYRNGDAIPNVTTAWSGLTTGAYCWYDNIATNEKYGALYNWYAVVDSRGLCPEGWHVPTDAEWDALINPLGGEYIAGGKMKAISDLWDSPNIDATNSSSFSGLPGGFRSNTSFSHLSIYGYWWSSTEYTDTYSWSRRLEDGYGYARDLYRSKWRGLSVRCLRD